MVRSLLFWKDRGRKSRKARRQPARRRSSGSSHRDADLAFERLEDRWVLSAGALDTTFNSGGALPGVLTSDLGFLEDGQEILLQTDGKILIGGTLETAGGGGSTRNFGVARYNDDGSLDTTFGVGDGDGVNGLATIDFFSQQDIFRDFALDSSGNIVIVGQVSGGGIGFGAARLDSSGLLDASFGTGGKVFTSLTGTTSPVIGGVALDSSENIIVAGHKRTGSGSATTDFLVIRYDSSGTLDASFGTGGVVLTDVDGNLDQLFDVAVQSDDKIVVGGSARVTATGDAGDFAVARYDTGGTLDATFGTGGIVTTHIVGVAGGPASNDVIDTVVVQNDGSIAVVGTTTSSSFSDIAMARYTSGGVLDATFNAAGSQAGVLRVNVQTFDFGQGLTIQPDDAYVVVGSTSVSSQEEILVMRVTTGGTLDGTFGTGGISTVDIAAGTVSERLRGVAMQDDGKIVAGGAITFSSTDRDFLLVRFESGLVNRSIAGDSDVDEGATYTLTLTDTDPTVTQWTIDWGDVVEVVAGNPASVDHVYADGPNTYTISAEVTNSGGTVPVDNTVEVTVNNVAPTLTLSGAADVDEGATYTLNLSSSDPGDDTITEWSIDWGDVVEIVAGNPVSVDHVYADGDANYVISATATDEDGTFAAGNTVAVMVNNVAPTLTLSGAADVNEAATYTLNLTSSDPGDDTITEWSIDWGDVVEIVAGNPASVDHVYADGDANYVISATATDEDGTFAAGNTVAVMVNNVAPTVDAGGPYETLEDLAITLTGTATDPAGAADPLLYEWDFDGDFFTVEAVGDTVTFDPVALGITGTTVVTVSLRVSDGDGGVTIDTADVTVLGQGTLLVDGVLHVLGTDAHDTVFIKEHSGDIKVYATFNDDIPVVFSAADVDEINVRVRGGCDVVVISQSVSHTTMIDGGDGADKLSGGSGRDVIVGGAGNDLLAGQGGDDVLLAGTGRDDLFGGSGDDVLVAGDQDDLLFGGSGRDLMIGGLDNDWLQGGTGDDILIGGVTIHDDDVAALDAVMDIWTSSDSFEDRVAELTGSGGMLESGVAVFDDNDSDILIGGPGRDLLFADTTFAGWDIDLVLFNHHFDYLEPTN